MNKSQKISQVENRNERHTYSGKFKDFQAFGNSYKGQRYSNLERDPYNKYQNFLYKRALFGLKNYPETEVKAMHPQKRERIERVNKKAQRELNLWKQERLIAMTNKILSIFKKDSLAGAMINLYSKPDPKYICKMNFKELGIEKDDIVNRLIEKKVLPNNFMTLSDES